jgi:hypothetical protein
LANASWTRGDLIMGVLRDDFDVPGVPLYRVERATPEISLSGQPARVSTRRFGTRPDTCVLPVNHCEPACQGDGSNERIAATEAAREHSEKTGRRCSRRPNSTWRNERAEPLRDADGCVVVVATRRFAGIVAYC